MNCGRKLCRGWIVWRRIDRRIPLGCAFERRFRAAGRLQSTLRDGELHALLVDEAPITAVPLEKNGLVLKLLAAIAKLRGGWALLEGLIHDASDVRVILGFQRVIEQVLPRGGRGI